MEYEDTGGCTGPEMEAKMVETAEGEFILERQPVLEDNQGGPRIVSYDAEEDVEQEHPYLILDVRSAQEFDHNRIHRGMSATF